MNYKIISAKCPFGNGVMINGVMDDRQFRSRHDADYRSDECAGRIAIRVAQQYGAKPAADIAFDHGIIHVYAVDRKYAAYAEFNNGWLCSSDTMWINTVNPAAIVEHFSAKSGEVNGVRQYT